MIRGHSLITSSFNFLNFIYLIKLKLKECKKNYCLVIAWVRTKAGSAPDILEQGFQAYKSILNFETVKFSYFAFYFTGIASLKDKLMASKLLNHKIIFSRSKAMNWKHEKK